MTRIVPIRLSKKELEGLDRMLDGSGAENRGEFIRLLLYREFVRRSKDIRFPKFTYQTAHRVGRPKISGVSPAIPFSGHLASVGVHGLVSETPDSISPDL